MTKTYSKKANAIRAAKSELGADAIAGTDFRLIAVDGGWAWDTTIQVFTPETAPTESELAAAPHVDPGAGLDAFDDAPPAAAPAPKKPRGKTPARTGADAAKDAKALKLGRSKHEQLIDTAQPDPDAPRAKSKAVGKRAAILQAAERGELPPAPDFSADTHRRYRPQLEEAVALVDDKDVAGLRALAIPTYGSSGQALDRYRNLAIVALEARAAG